MDFSNSRNWHFRIIVNAGIIETHNLSKTYGQFGALHDFSSSVPGRSVFALLGAGGAGKTTAIKALLNLVPATAVDRKSPPQDKDFSTSCRNSAGPFVVIVKPR
jgi:ABC-type multidrug transport system ATPase subunit